MSKKKRVVSRKSQRPTEAAGKVRAAKKRARPARAASNAPADAKGLYADLLSRTEQERLPAARQMQGLDEEIALLRVKVSELVAKHPDDIDGLVKAIRLLLRVMATKYRLSPQAEDDLLKNVAGVVNGIGGMVLPEAFGHGEEGKDE